MRIFIILALCVTSLAAQQNYNALNYYAVDNSVDGQPQTDNPNLIRFFPVYSLKDSVKEVEITIYYGDKIFTSLTDKMSGGKYWQALLPQFKLGEAIQRIEAKMKFGIDELYKQELIALRRMRSKIWLFNKEIRDKLNSILVWVDPDYKQYITASIVEKFYSSDDLNAYNAAQDISFIKRFISDTNWYIYKADSVKEKAEVMLTLLVEDKQVSETIRNYTSRYKIIKSEDSIKAHIYENIIGYYSDTTFSGPAIRKSDLLIDDSIQYATILYRYYKNNLRYRKALDPAERLGIFRLRYIPFPITGTPAKSKVSLLSPGSINSPVVFEIGLNFGDEVVSGDATLKPTLSINRLGVAMIITEKLFKSDAQILGVALTYDFNSYASIAVGRNLAQSKSYPYYSLGINKKAFSELLNGIASIF
ncbi:MAG: hypothetical protein JW995_13905 [Melioribacteraceae bacterium]|nr:hypothetical protein [Melioribacteraceae bacterium]